MEISELLYAQDRQAWRGWLEKNHTTAKEIWLVYFNKKSGKPRIPYHHAVEEALCFGWIDSIIKSVDEVSAAQRFTPRNPKSGYSQVNKERLKRLIAGDKVIPQVVNTVEDILNEPYEFPDDIMKELQANKKAWDNFRRYSDAYQRIRIAYIDAARIRPDIFMNRLKYFIDKTAQDKQFGNGIEDFY